MRAHIDAHSLHMFLKNYDPHTMKAVITEKHYAFQLYCETIGSLGQELSSSKRRDVSYLSLNNFSKKYL